MHFFHKTNHTPGAGWVWVFGSNQAGIHSHGDAKTARNNFGAVYGVGNGRMRSSYAIPIQSKHMAFLPLEAIKASVDVFLAHAASSPNERFHVSALGCSLGEQAGWGIDDIAPLFEAAPENCFLPESWKPLLLPDKALA